jgi:hypothetical protein
VFWCCSLREVEEVEEVSPPRWSAQGAEAEALYDDEDWEDDEGDGNEQKLYDEDGFEDEEIASMPLHDSPPRWSTQVRTPVRAPTPFVLQIDNSPEPS